MSQKEIFPKFKIHYMFYFFLVTLWPFLNFLGSKDNQQQINLFNFSALFVCFFLSACLAIRLCQFIFRLSYERMLAVYSFFVIIFFSYSEITLFIHRNTHIAQAYIVVIGLLILFSLILVWLAKYKTFNIFLKTLIITLFSYAVLNNIFVFCKYSNTKMTSINLDLTEGDNPKNLNKNLNIYFLLLDAYPRADTLELNTGFKNNLFLDNLVKKGFLVAKKSYSNYPSTVPSLTSIFKGSYINDSDITGDDIINPKMNILFKMKRNGYKFVMLPSHHEYLGARNAADIIISPSNNFLFSVTNIHFLSKTPLKALTHYLKDYLYFGMKEVDEAINVKCDKKFVFMHLLHFHDHIYNASCKVDSLGDFTASASNAIQNLKCVNNFVEQALDKIIKNDPHSVIIVQSDHGPWFWRKQNNAAPNSSDELDRWYSNFSAFYLPGLNNDSEIAKYLLQSPSPVNDFNVIFSYLSDSKPELLPDQIFYGSKNLDHLRSQKN